MSTSFPTLELMRGCAGVKVFMGSSTGSLLVEDDDGVRDILRVIRRRASFHSEDEFRLRERRDLRREGDPSSHPVWRDETAALSSTQRLVRLAHETGKRVHILHVTTKQEMAFLAAHKDVASVEVTPHHLTLAAPDCYERLGTLAQPGTAGRCPRASRWRGRTGRRPRRRSRRRSPPGERAGGEPPAQQEQREEGRGHHHERHRRAAAGEASQGHPDRDGTGGDDRARRQRLRRLAGGERNDLADRRTRKERPRRRHGARDGGPLLVRAPPEQHEGDHGQQVGEQGGPSAHDGILARRPRRSHHGAAVLPAQARGAVPEAPGFP